MHFDRRNLLKAAALMVLPLTGCTRGKTKTHVRFVNNLNVPVQVVAMANGLPFITGIIQPGHHSIKQEYFTSDIPGTTALVTGSAYVKGKKVDLTIIPVITAPFILEITLGFNNLYTLGGTVAAPFIDVLVA